MCIFVVFFHSTGSGQCSYDCPRVTLSVSFQSIVVDYRVVLQGLVMQLQSSIRCK